MRRGLKWILAVLGLLVAASALYLWASPYLFLRSLQQAILRGDRAKLERLVDFPRVREGLKSQLQAKLLQEIQKKAEANPFAGLAYLFMANLVDPLVEAFVSPEGFATLGTGAEPGEASKEEVKRWRLKYQGFQTAYLYHPHDPQSRLYLERQGVWGWRVVRMEIPLD